jgi:hypothetical protein
MSIRYKKIARTLTAGSLLFGGVLTASVIAGTVPASAGAFLRTVHAGNGPDPVSSDGTHVWIASSGHGSLGYTNPVGSDSHGVSSYGTHIWMAKESAEEPKESAEEQSPHNSTVTELNASTGAVGQTIPVGLEALGVSSDGTHVGAANNAFIPGGSRCAVASVTELNASDGSVVETIPGDPGHCPDAVSSHHTHVWVANGVPDVDARKMVTELNPSNGSEVQTIAVGSGPSGGLPDAVTAPAILIGAAPVVHAASSQISDSVVVPSTTEPPTTTTTTTAPVEGIVALALSEAGTPFASTSVWNTPLPADTPVNSNNADYLNVIKDNDCGERTAVPERPVSCTPSPSSDVPNIATFSAPLYVVPADQPKVSVTAGCPGSGRSFSQAFLNSIAGGVPVPADAHAAAGSDEEIQIYQPSTNHYWEFWRFRKNSSGHWEACWGGEITDVSQSDGIFPNWLGATATSLPLLGSVVRIQELQSGQIDHAIGLVIGDDATADLNPNVVPAKTRDPNHRAPGVSWPATHGDGGSSDPNAIPEGTRLRLPASLDLNNYDLTPIARVIAVAAQKYGFIVNDSSPTPTLSMRLGDPTTYTAAGLADPYTSGPGVDGQGTQGLLDGGAQNAIMRNFPWNELQALPYDYGEPRPAHSHH